MSLPAARPHFLSVFPLDLIKPRGVAGSGVIAGLATKLRERATGQTWVLPFSRDVGRSPKASISQKEFRFAMLPSRHMQQVVAFPRSAAFDVCVMNIIRRSPPQKKTKIL